MSKNKKKAFLVGRDAIDNPRGFTAQMAENLYAQGEFKFAEQNKYCYFIAEPTCSSLDRILIGIERESVYTNRYEGLIAIDVQSLESCAGEAFVKSFLTKLERLNDKAAFLFFAMPNGRIAYTIARHFTHIDTVSSISINGGI